MSGFTITDYYDFSTLPALSSVQSLPDFNGGLFSFSKRRNYLSDLIGTGSGVKKSSNDFVTSIYDVSGDYSSLPDGSRCPAFELVLTTPDTTGIPAVGDTKAGVMISDAISTDNQRNYKLVCHLTQKQISFYTQRESENIDGSLIKTVEEILISNTDAIQKTYYIRGFFCDGGIIFNINDGAFSDNKISIDYQFNATIIDIASQSIAVFCESQSGGVAIELNKLSIGYYDFLIQDIIPSYNFEDENGHYFKIDLTAKKNGYFTIYRFNKPSDLTDGYNTKIKLNWLTYRNASRSAIISLNNKQMNIKKDETRVVKIDDKRYYNLSAKLLGGSGTFYLSTHKIVG